jgi:hypothetical protein
MRDRHSGASEPPHPALGADLPTGWGGEKCTRCGRVLDICACCHEPKCPAAICYDCQNRAFKQTVPQPHAHGG